MGLITNIRFHGKAGRSCILHTMRRGGNVAYISNFRYWRGLWKRDEDQLIRRVVSGLSHETLHKVLQHRIRYTASNRLDRIHHKYTHKVFINPEGIALPL